MTSEPRAYRRNRRVHGWQRGAFAGRYASSAPPASPWRSSGPRTG